MIHFNICFHNGVGFITISFSQQQGSSQGEKEKGDFSPLFSFLPFIWKERKIIYIVFFPFPYTKNKENFRIFLPYAYSLQQKFTHTSLSSTRNHQKQMLQSFHRYLPLQPFKKNAADSLHDLSHQFRIREHPHKETFVVTVQQREALSTLRFGRRRAIVHWTICAC